MVKQWYSTTPEHFIFCPKLPKRITHDNRLENSSGYLDHFVRTMANLKEKLGPTLIQLPPGFKFKTHSAALTDFVDGLKGQYRYAIEFRNKSWFIPEVAKLLADRNICQAWSLNQYLTTPATVTSDLIYLRFVGDRTITEFRKLQKDQKEKMEQWSKNLSDSEESVHQRFIFFNNHFAGFGPGSANEFRRLMGLFELNWKIMSADSKQRTMFDFSR
jgi:uncharacterized protein YecE (DUF72 family)